MKVILRPRKTGRTQELIRLCAEAEANGEVSYIVCHSQEEASRIYQEAEKLELFVAFPITYYEFLARQYAGRNIQNFFIDNVDRFLQSMTTVTIQAITLEKIEDDI